MRVKLETLEKVAHLIFEHMRDLEVEEVEIDNDYYWNIPFEQKYDRYEPPTDLDLGQLSEDWRDIINVAENRIDIVNSGLPSAMTSEAVAVTALNFFISPETNPFVTGFPPVTQPRVTIVLSLTSTQTGQTARATIQQTVPQRGGSY